MLLLACSLQGLDQRHIFAEGYVVRAAGPYDGSCDSEWSSRLSGGCLDGHRRVMSSIPKPDIGTQNHRNRIGHVLKLACCGVLKGIGSVIFTAIPPKAEARSSIAFQDL